jgi:glycine/D-amino acid oxidase-like deaminating enzyme
MTNVPIWEDHSWVQLPVLEGDVTADVCVVGLGGSGLACIMELLALGQRVIGIDAIDVGAGAAGRNGGFLLAGAARFYHSAVASFGRERALALYQLTLSQIEQMHAETPDAVRRTGTLRIALSQEEEEDCRQQYQAMKADHLPVVTYDGPEGRGLLLPTDCSYDPLKRCRMMALRAIEGGARLYGNSKATGISGNEVHTTSGRVSCRKTIVAVDGGLEQLVPDLKDRVRTARLQMLATAPARTQRFSRPVYARWGYEYWQQLPDGTIALGGFRDTGGEEEWTGNGSPSAPVQDALEFFLREHLRVEENVTHRWAATVSYTNTGIPVVEELRPGLWVTGAYSGTGNVMGAICGRGVAQAVVKGESDILRLFPRH